MHGFCGHMGQVISDLVAKDANAEIVAGIDVTDKGNTTYPVFINIKECQTEADVLIDFSLQRQQMHYWITAQSVTFRLFSAQQVCLKNSLQKLKRQQKRFRY